MKKLRILNFTLKRTKTYPIIFSFLLFVLVDAFIIMLAEPSITTYGDALWYCYVVMATVGFGDFITTTLIGRIASVLLTVYALFVFAIVTGVVVNFHGQLIELQQKNKLAALVDKLERLPELSKEELKEISEKAKNYIEKKK